jgi:uncharacterized protein involved in type VI secretion and phage assembly
MHGQQRFYGKYRGTVVNNLDPMQIGRVQVSVPDVSSALPSTWAMPCLPVAGTQMGLYAVPPVGANVWVEFEQGDPDLPIWVGGFWGSAAEVPALARTAPSGLSTIALSAAGASILINDTGIYIDNGKGARIVMVGPAVTVNDGALAVT